MVHVVRVFRKGPRGTRGPSVPRGCVGRVVLVHGVDYLLFILPKCNLVKVLK